MILFRDIPIREKRNYLIDGKAYCFLRSEIWARLADHRIGPAKMYGGQNPSGNAFSWQRTPMATRWS